jgi:hypothetical protein
MRHIKRFIFESMDSDLGYKIIELKLDDITKDEYDPANSDKILNCVKTYMATGEGNFNEWWWDELEDKISYVLTKYNIRKTNLFNFIKEYLKN